MGSENDASPYVPADCFPNINAADSHGAPVDVSAVITVCISSHFSSVISVGSINDVSSVSSSGTLRGNTTTGTNHSNWSCSIWRFCWFFCLVIQDMLIKQNKTVKPSVITCFLEIFQEFLRVFISLCALLCCFALHQHYILIFLFRTYF